MYEKLFKCVRNLFRDFILENWLGMLRNTYKYIYCYIVYNVKIKRYIY